MSTASITHRPMAGTAVAAAFIAALAVAGVAAAQNHHSSPPPKSVGASATFQMPDLAANMQYRRPDRPGVQVGMP
jgi:hypothetical protein